MVAADAAGALEAEAAASVLSVSGIVVLAGEHQVADAGRQLRRGLEQRGVMALHLLQRAAERVRRRAAPA